MCGGPIDFEWYELKVDGATSYHYGTEELIEEKSSAGVIQRDEENDCYAWQAASMTHLIRGRHDDLDEAKMIVESIVETVDENGVTLLSEATLMS